tara:strand:+ start:283 stop:408 length:126 start_codon:yes stop_codon:yes gene_type:complete
MKTVAEINRRILAEQIKLRAEEEKDPAIKKILERAYLDLTK